jgi:hypothetical protein
MRLHAVGCGDVAKLVVQVTLNREIQDARASSKHGVN